MADLCVDEYTDHGHCGIVDARGSVDNDRTLEVYAKIAVAQAEAGAHVVAPSGDDGRSGRRDPRRRSTAPASSDVSILAYAAKYASGLYGPFREAVDVRSSVAATARATSRTGATPARRWSRSSPTSTEGADMVMVKPALSLPRRHRRRARRGRRAGRGVPRERRVRDDQGRRGQRMDRPRRGRHRAAHRHQAGRAPTSSSPTSRAGSPSAGCQLNRSTP
jgi:hypothetical protein